MPDHVVVQCEQLHYHGDHSSDRTDRFAHQKGHRRQSFWIPYATHMARSSTTHIPFLKRHIIVCDRGSGGYRVARPKHRSNVLLLGSRG